MTEQNMSEQVESVQSTREFMERYLPNRLAQLERDGCCIHCGQKKPTSPWKGRPRV